MRRTWLAAVVAAGLIQGSAGTARAQQPAPKPAPRPAPVLEPRPWVGLDGLGERIEGALDAARWEIQDLDIPVWQHDFDMRFDHAFDFDFDFDFNVDTDVDWSSFTDAGLDLDAQRWEMDAARDALESQRWQVEDAMQSIDRDAIREQLQDAQWQLSQVDPQRLADDAERMAERATADALDGLRAGAGALREARWQAFDGLGVSGARALRSVPPEPWASNDPADSLYRLARETLNRGDWRRASTLFGEIVDKYPNSTYAPDALYWKAFSLYRIGTTAELTAARSALDAQKSRYPDAYARSDGATLASRINGALATRGDAAAARNVSQAASQDAPSCDKEEMAVRVEALNALSQIDAAAAVPLLTNILSRQDDCTVMLRRRAIFILGKQGDSSAAPILARVVKTDPDASVRSDAVMWLARVPGDQTISTLEELMRTSDDERVQRAAIRALAAHDSPRARQMVRAIIERNDVPEKTRIEAIEAIDDRDKATPEDGAFLRALYPRLQSERMRKATINGIARMGGAENESWLYALVRNNDTPTEMRAEALSRVGRLSTTSITDLTKLYDELAARELREQLISVYARRKEQQATDKLLDIVRSGTDPQLRRMAISALTRKNDPRTTKLLLEIIDQ